MSEMHYLIAQNIHNCHQIRFESVQGIDEPENHQLEDDDSEPEVEDKLFKEYRSYKTN